MGAFLSLLPRRLGGDVPRTIEVYPGRLVTHKHRWRLPHPRKTRVAGCTARPRPAALKGPPVFTGAYDAMAHRRPLNRLPEAVLPAALVNQLAQIGVATVGELFHASPLQVVAYTDLSLGELERLRADVATKVAPPSATALSLLRDRQSHAENTDRYYISTGLLPLDQSLRGGIPLGSVADICGSPGAGKTQFCLFMAITTILDSTDSSIIYVDAELKVDSNRLLQLLTAQYKWRHPAEEPSAEVLDSYLQRIVVSSRPNTVTPILMAAVSRFGGHRAWTSSRRCCSASRRTSFRCSARCSWWIRWRR